MNGVPLDSRRDIRPRMSSGAKLRTLLAALSKLRSTAIATLREIFDEAAYERFLARHHTSAGTASYADFCREQYQGRPRRPRCC